MGATQSNESADPAIGAAASKDPAIGAAEDEQLPVFEINPTNESNLLI